METEEKQSNDTIGEMRKQRETMPDGKRYIIYYTFDDEDKKAENEVKENV